MQGEPVGHALEYLTAGLGNGKAIAERTFRIEHRPFVDGRVGTSHLVEDVQKHRVAEKRHRLQFTLGDSPQVANAGGLLVSICKSKDCVRLRPFTDDGSSCRWRCTAGPRCGSAGVRVRAMAASARGSADVNAAHAAAPTDSRSASMTSRRFQSSHIASGGSWPSPMKGREPGKWLTEISSRTRGGRVRA